MVIEYDSEFDKNENMFTDLALSKDLMLEFDAKRTTLSSLNVMVLARTNWPFSGDKAKGILDLPSHVCLLFYHSLNSQ